MTRDTALRLLAEYEQHIPALDGMRARFPDDGSEAKAMRWLGYAQGIAVGCGAYSLDEVESHSRDGVVSPPDAAAWRERDPYQRGWRACSGDILRREAMDL